MLKFPRRTILFAVAVIVFSWNAVIKAAPPEPTAPATQTSIHFEQPLLFASLLEAAAVAPGMEWSGLVVDLLIDFRTGWAPFLVVRSAGAADDDLRIVAFNSAIIEMASDQQALQAQFTDKSLPTQNWPKFHGGEIISNDQAARWLQTLKITAPPAADAAPLELTSLRSFRKQAVLVGRESELEQAVIKDFVIDAASQRCAYTLLDLDAKSTAQGRSGKEQANEFLVVPLSAYLAENLKGDWRLEIPIDELTPRERTSASQLIRELPRGWIEYVSVRYGGEPTGGVQSGQQGSLKAAEAEQPMP